MDLKTRALAACAALVLIACYCAWLWQPERQVRLHQKHFLKAIERRNWNAMGGFLADNYSDRWGHDKAFVLAASREVFGQFFLLTVESRTDACDLEGDTATVRAPVRITGTGGPIAQYAIGKVNALREPFIFTWQHVGSKPWNWHLARIDHAELELTGVPGSNQL